MVPHCDIFKPGPAQPGGLAQGPGEGPGKGAPVNPGRPEREGQYAKGVHQCRANGRARVILLAIPCMVGAFLGVIPLLPLLLSNWSPMVVTVVILILWGELKTSRIEQRVQALEKRSDDQQDAIKDVNSKLDRLIDALLTGKIKAAAD